VNQLATGYDSERGNANDYIVTAIMNEVYLTVEAETTIPIPHVTQYRKAAAGNKIKPMTAVALTLENYPGDDMQASFDMCDLIESCCETDKDRTFVEMREAGYTLKEIADTLGVSTPTVYRLKRELYARVLEKSGLQPTE
jgi:uncharacterized protein YerC